ncbi:MAG: ATP-binding protein [Pirellulales bacterium]
MLPFDFEQLGAFYLGREYDLAAQQPADKLVLYDAKDLTTHAVCVGMTGSGKTGLCLALLEEAAIDGIPAIAIDPKGDLGNLLLTFPELRPADFAPWIDPAEAARKGIPPDDLAKQTAERWKQGLGEWGQDGQRIARFRSAADVAIYTPGSSAGLPLGVMRSFAAPSPAVLADADALRERVSAATAGLLALLGIDADPLRSREHILIATLFDRAWREGRGLDMAGLIREIQSPPADKIGVIDLDSFFPPADRFALAMQLNNLLASPGFSAWMSGEPLDIQRLLYTPEGKPRLAILSIAHLSDAERMFFVTILLNEVIAWMRAQSGTSSLRALLYMDEVFGYFPPTANPPTKTPMLTLLKQARAYGLGVVLATQNPVDLDYKGLSNAGTWFLGRLQTERDKARVLDGLEGASAAAGAQFDRRQMEQILSGLGNRVFLLNNVHEDHPVVFQSRWALSYLRGPLTRDQIAGLMKERKEEGARSREQGVASPPASAASSSLPAPSSQLPATPAPSSPLPATDRPLLPPDVPEAFIPCRAVMPAGATVLYRPALYGVAEVHFVDSKAGVDVNQRWRRLAALDDSLPENPWGDDGAAEDEPELEKSPEAAARFATLPGELSKPKAFAGLTTGLKDFLYRNYRLSVWKCAALDQTSRPGESQADFRIRLSQSAREERDRQVEKIRDQYAAKLQRLDDQIRRAQQKVEKEKSQANQQTMQAAMSFGSSILGVLFGRKLKSVTNVNRAGSSVRAAGRAMEQRADVGAAEDNVEALAERRKQLENELAAEKDRIAQSISPEALALEELRIAPKKTNITVSQVTLAWRPFYVDAAGREQPAW